MKKLCLLVLSVFLLYGCQKNTEEVAEKGASEVAQPEETATENVIHDTTGTDSVLEEMDGIINDTRVRLRVKPNLDSDTWYYFNTGDKVSILDKSDKPYALGGEYHYWYKVESEDSPMGWVYGAYIDIAQEDTPVVVQKLSIDAWCKLYGFGYNEKYNSLYSSRKRGTTSYFDFTSFNQLEKEMLDEIESLGFEWVTLQNNDYSIFTNLKRLNIRNVENPLLYGIEKANLDELIVSYSNIDLDILEQLSVKKLTIRTKVKPDIDVIPKLVSLEEFSICSSEYFEIPDMSDLINLKDVAFFYEGFKDFKGVETIPNPFNFYITAGDNGTFMKEVSFDAFLDSKVSAIFFFYPDYDNYADRFEPFKEKMLQKNPDFKVYIDG